MNVRRWFSQTDPTYIYELRVESRAEKLARSVPQRVPEPLQHVLGTLMFIVLIPLELIVVLPLLGLWILLDRLESK